MSGHSEDAPKGQKTLDLINVIQNAAERVVHVTILYFSNHQFNVTSYR